MPTKTMIQDHTEALEALHHAEAEHAKVIAARDRNEETDANAAARARRVAVTAHQIACARCAAADADPETQERLERLYRLQSQHLDLQAAREDAHAAYTRANTAYSFRFNQEHSALIAEMRRLQESGVNVLPLGLADTERDPERLREAAATFARLAKAAGK